MKILELKVRNFLSIGEVDARLDGRGLVLIQGKNKDDTSQDSNGAGKSTMADAISWCLFGITARGESGDRVVNRVAKKNTSVSAVIEDETVSYKVTRYRKHKAYKNRLVILKFGEPGEDSTDMTKGTDKLTQELVCKIVGCSEDVFNAAIYMGQDCMPSLPDMTDKTLKMLVEEAAGINRLEGAHQVARARLKEAETANQSAIDAKGFSEADIENAKETKADLKSREGTWTKQRKIEMVELLKGIKADKEKLTSLQSFLEKATYANDQSTKRLSDIKVQLSEISKERVEQKNLAGSVAEAQRAVTVAEHIFSTGNKDFTKANKAAATVEEKVGTPCGECGQDYTKAELSVSIDAARARQKSTAKNFSEAKIAFKGAELTLGESQKKLTTYEDGMTDVSAINEEAETLRGSVTQFGELKAKVANFKENLKSKLLSAKADQEKPNPYAELVVDKQAEVEKLEAKHKEQTKAIKVTQKKVDVTSNVATLYSPAGVRAYILDTVTPFLNDRTSHYLSALTDGNINAVWSTISFTAKSEMREKFSIKVTSKVGAEDFKGLSGGEKRKVRLSTAMALQDLVASRASKPINLFIADEIDHALDEAGLERLTGILNDKARERGTVLVISHNSLDDWISNSVKMVKSEGYTSMEGTAL